MKDLTKRFKFGYRQFPGKLYKQFIIYSCIATSNPHVLFANPGEST